MHGEISGRLTENRRSKARQSGMPARVYLVEDSPISVNLLNDPVRDAGAAVIGNTDVSSSAMPRLPGCTPECGDHRHQFAKGNRVDVRRALASSRDKRPPRIVFTNVTSDEYQREAESLGAAYFLDKNRQMRELLRILGLQLC